MFELSRFNCNESNISRCDSLQCPFNLFPPSDFCRKSLSLSLSLPCASHLGFNFHMELRWIKWSISWKRWSNQLNGAVESWWDTFAIYFCRSWIPLWKSRRTMDCTSKTTLKQYLSHWKLRTIEKCSNRIWTFFLKNIFTLHFLLSTSSTTPLWFDYMFFDFDP